ncbi:hypothetical protein D3C77_153420 [compost metagenome]
MASFFDTLNEGLGNVTGTPLGQLGMGLLMASGQQQGNPNFGNRLGQAFGSMSELQRAQALQQYRQQLVAAQQAEQAQRVQAAQLKADQDQRQQAAFQNPDVLSQLGPLGQALARLGVDPGAVLKANAGDQLTAHRQAQMQQQAQQFDQRQAHQGGGGGSSGPRMPTPRQLIEEPLADGTVQKHLFDPTTQSYQPYGAPYNPYSTRGKGKAKAADPVANLVDELTPEAPAAGPGLESLPGTGSLQSYAPPQGAALLMQGAPKITSSGSVPSESKPTTAAPTGDLAAAKAAVAAGKSRQAVIGRLRQAGYSDAQIQQAGI